MQPDYVYGYPTANHVHLLQKDKIKGSIAQAIYLIAS